jgi:hypothetical protein
MSAGFNPIKEDKEGKVNKIVWSSETINKAISGINEGKKLISNPFYENKTYLLKGDITFKHTEEEIEEWLKCKNDIVYFANKWCKLMTPEGIKNIILRDYQIKYLKHLVDNRLSIMLSSRQSGKTTTSAIFLMSTFVWWESWKLSKVLLNLGEEFIALKKNPPAILMELCVIIVLTLFFNPTIRMSLVEPPTSIPKLKVV